jgi:hypothetical protein
MLYQAYIVKVIYIYCCKHRRLFQYKTGRITNVVFNFDYTEGDDYAKYS